MVQKLEKVNGLDRFRYVAGTLKTVLLYSLGLPCTLYEVLHKYNFFFTIARACQHTTSYHVLYLTVTLI